MPAPKSFTPFLAYAEAQALILPERFKSPHEASIEARLAAIEERLKRDADERAAWDRLKMIGLVLAA